MTTTNSRDGREGISAPAIEAANDATETTALLRAYERDRDRLQARLSEVLAEADRLRTALNMQEGTAWSRKRPVRRPRPGTIVGRVYRHIARHPGMLSGEIAQSLDLSIIVTHTALHTLRKQGCIRSEGRRGNFAHYVVDEGRSS
ncbi:MAG TPA: hypothetical protein VGG39_23555 [Polyangiaceae bacterium]|jgi:hypothetical protein